MTADQLDRESWRKVREGHLEALEDVFSRHERELRTLLDDRVGRNRTSDLLTAVFLRAWRERHLATFDIDQGLAPWLRNIAMNMSKSRRWATFRYRRYKNRALRSIPAPGMPTTDFRAKAQARRGRRAAVAKHARAIVAGAHFFFNVIGTRRRLAFAAKKYWRRPSKTPDVNQTNELMDLRRLIKAWQQGAKPPRPHRCNKLCHGSRSLLSIESPIHDLTRAAAWVCMTLIFVCATLITITPLLRSPISTSVVNQAIVLLGFMLITGVGGATFLFMLTNALRPQQLPPPPYEESQ